MKIAVKIVVLLSVVVYSSCQKKKLDIDFKQDECHKLKINSPVYSWVKDPSCGGDSDSAIIKIRFKHPEQKDCIEKIFLKPVFYNVNQKELDAAYEAVLEKSHSDVVLYDDSATFIVKAKFISGAEAAKLNNVYLSFHTENQLSEKSKDTEVRVNGKCSTVLPEYYDVKDTFNVNTELVQVTFYDDADEDGDVISVYLNGQWVLENFHLTNKGDTFTFKVNQGENDFVLFAVNEGESGPNTCAISVNSSEKITLRQDLKTGEAVKIIF